MPQIDNVTFFPQAFSSFLTLILFFGLTFKFYSVNLAKTFKLRVELTRLVINTTASKKSLVKSRLQVFYGFQNLFLAKALFINEPSFLP